MILRDATRTSSFNEVKIQQVEDYAFGEQIAVLEERRSADYGSFFAARSYQTFAERLLNLSGPWMRIDEQGDQVLALPLFSESYVMVIARFVRRILPRIFGIGLIAVAFVSLLFQLVNISTEGAQRSCASVGNFPPQIDRRGKPHYCPASNHRNRNCRSS